MQAKSRTGNCFTFVKNKAVFMENACNFCGILRLGIANRKKVWYNTKKERLICEHFTKHSPPDKVLIIGMQ